MFGIGCFFVRKSLKTVIPDLIRDPLHRVDANNCETVIKSWILNQVQKDGEGGVLG